MINHHGQAHIAVGSGRPPAFDWESVTDATFDCDGDDLANGGQLVDWVDRIGGWLMTPSASPVRSEGVNRRGRVRYTGGLTSYHKSNAGAPLAMIGGSLTNDFMVCAIADLQSVSAQNTGTWDDSPIWSTSGFRAGGSYRKVSSAPPFDVYGSNAWEFDGSFKNATQTFGSTLSGPHIFTWRRLGTNLYSGVDGVETVETGVGAISGAIGDFLSFFANPNWSRTGDGYLYKLCAKANGAPQVDAIAGFKLEYSIP